MCLIPPLFFCSFHLSLVLSFSPPVREVGYFVLFSFKQLVCSAHTCHRFAHRPSGSILCRDFAESASAAAPTPPGSHGPRGPHGAASPLPPLPDPVGSFTLPRRHPSHPDFVRWSGPFSSVFGLPAGKISSALICVEHLHLADVWGGWWSFLRHPPATLLPSSLSC